MTVTTRLIAAVLMALASAQDVIAAGVVDLDDAAALSRLATERPEHHSKVVRILHDAQRLPETEVVGYLRTSHQTDDAALAPTLLTSYPPQRRLSFSLDTVQYRATVVVVTAKPQIVR